jgi:glycosyltransferase involved in cell wall biosynthesis
LKKLLLVSYHFPPDAEVGGLRVQKFAKYLPLYGWEPFVLSVDESYYPLKDFERVKDVNCKVFRTKMMLNPRQTYTKLKSLISFATRKTGNSADGNPRMIEEGALELRERSISEFKRFILSLLWLPDDRTGWILPAVLRGLVLIKKYGIETLMTTSPPHSVQIIGYLLKRITGCRWVIDFRDPWTLFLEKKRGGVNTIQRWLEAKVIHHADVVITATDFVRECYLRVYPDLPREKFICVPNGFDLEDMVLAKTRNPVKDEKLTISYLGEFYVGRSPEVFLRAVSDLVRNGKIPFGQLRLRFIGKVRYFGRKSLEALLLELGLSSITEIIDQVPHTKAMEYVVNSKVLLVFSPNPFMQPMKVFEYMASGAFVIAFTPPGALADLVRGYSKGIVVDYDDFDGAKMAMLRCYDMFVHSEGRERNLSQEMDESVLIFERKKSTQHLAKHL